MDDEGLSGMFFDDEDLFSSGSSGEIPDYKDLSIVEESLEESSDYKDLQEESLGESLDDTIPFNLGLEKYLDKLKELQVATEDFQKSFTEGYPEEFAKNLAFE